MRRNSLLVWGVSAAFLMTPTLAGAADLPAIPPAPPAPPPAPAPQKIWTGFYVGAQAGGVVNSDRDSFVAGPVPGDLGGFPNGGAGGSTGVASSDDGMFSVVGVHLGYNWQSDSNFVFGAEADINAFGRIDDFLGSVRGRVGYAQDRLLFYTTAGVAYLSGGDDEGIFIGGAGGDGGVGGSGPAAGGGGGGGGGGFAHQVVGGDSDESVGFVGGIGAEYRIAPSVGVGLEGLYYTFDDNGTGQSDFFTVRGSLNFHLNDPDAAGGMPAYAAAAPTVADWGGFYVGGHGGAAWGTSDDVISDVSLSDGQDGQDGLDGAGPDAGGGAGGGGGGAISFAELSGGTDFVGGLHAGYNWQNGNFVYGAEADASFATAENRDYLASIRARVGWAHNSFLFYGTGGVAFTGGDQFTGIFAGDGQDGADGGDAANGVAGVGGAGGAGGAALASRDSDHQVGFVVGAGIETKVNDRINLGLEGLYYGFSGDGGSGRNIGSTGQSFGGATDPDALVVRSRITFELQK